ncbi:MAG: YggT family protein [Candidatus Limnocylindria bacterium]
MDPVAFLRVFAVAFIDVLGSVLTVAIFVRVILSWIQIRLPAGIADFLFSATEPILGPIRRALPAMGGIDFSPFIAVILIQIVQGVLLTIVRL